MTAQGRRRWLFLLGVIAQGVFAQTDDLGAADALALQREAFLAALELARAGEQAPEPDSQALQRYPLYPYLRAERIARALEHGVEPWTAADEHAGALLAHHGAEPVTWSLRRSWLSSLARREHWSAYREQYREAVAGSRLRCLDLTARIALGDVGGIAPLIVDQWLVGQPLPAECEPVFRWLRAEGSLTDNRIEQRVRLLLENGHTGFARVIARRLPEGRAAPLLRWADFIEQPEAQIDVHLERPVEHAESPALLDGWSRLARNDPAAALQRYQRLVSVTDLDASQTSPFARALALGLAWDRRVEALDFFDLVGEQALDDYALEWRARAAAWARDWAGVESSIAAMSDAQRATSRWRYWAARAAAHRGERHAAEALYASLAGDDNYYSAMAAAHLGRPVEPRVEPLPLHASVVDTLAARPAFVRARELLRSGLPAAAMREWRYGYAQLDEPARRQTIHLASRWGRHDVAVASATRHGVFNDYALLYPKPYAAEVQAAVRSSGLASELIYGVIRQESLYRADAVSSAGARGLMQLLPGTARPLARDAGLTERPDLLEPGINIRLGTAELRRLGALYDGQLPLMLAAYNAGANAVARWLPDEPLDSDIWIENVPYNETRDYVRRVLWHTLVLRWLETGGAQSTRSWLEPVSR